MTDLRGHVAFITGGNGGIGLGMAMDFARAGADVAIWGTNPAKNEAAAAHRPGGHSGAHRGVRRRRRGRPAGELRPHRRRPRQGRPARRCYKVLVIFVDLTLEEWRCAMAVNLDGAFVSLRLGARHLVERGEGGVAGGRVVDLGDPRRPVQPPLRR